MHEEGVFPLLSARSISIGTGAVVVVVVEVAVDTGLFPKWVTRLFAGFFHSFLREFEWEDREYDVCILEAETIPPISEASLHNPESAVQPIVFDNLCFPVLVGQRQGQLPIDRLDNFLVDTVFKQANESNFVIGHCFVKGIVAVLLPWHSFSILARYP
jgi:hypothetical protein